MSGNDLSETEVIVREKLGIDAAIEFWRLAYCCNLKKIYMLSENFISTGLPSIPLPYHFILTPAAPTTPVLYIFSRLSELLFMTVISINTFLLSLLSIMILLIIISKNIAWSIEISNQRYKMIKRIKATILFDFNVVLAKKSFTKITFSNENFMFIF